MKTQDSVPGAQPGRKDAILVGDPRKGSHNRARSSKS